MSEVRSILRGLLTFAIFVTVVVCIVKFSFIAAAIPQEPDENFANFWNQLMGLIRVGIPLLVFTAFPIIVVGVLAGIYYLAKNISKLI